MQKILRGIQTKTIIITCYFVSRFILNNIDLLKNRTSKVLYQNFQQMILLVFVGFSLSRINFIVQTCLLDYSENFLIGAGLSIRISQARDDRVLKTFRKFSMRAVSKVTEGISTNMITHVRHMCSRVLGDSISSNF